MKFSRFCRVRSLDYPSASFGRAYSVVDGFMKKTIICLALGLIASPALSQEQCEYVLKRLDTVFYLKDVTGYENVDSAAAFRDPSSWTVRCVLVNPTRFKSQSDITRSGCFTNNGGSVEGSRYVGRGRWWDASDKGCMMMPAGGYRRNQPMFECVDDEPYDPSCLSIEGFLDKKGQLISMWSLSGCASDMYNEVGGVLHEVPDSMGRYLFVGSCALSNSFWRTNWRAGRDKPVEKPYFVSGLKRMALLGVEQTGFYVKERSLHGGIKGAF